MQYMKLLGWGIVIYAVMYLLVVTLSLYHVGALFVHISSFATLLLVASLAGLSLHRRSMWDVLPYALAWMLEVMVLDGLLSMPFVGWQLYLNWNVWVGYVLVFFVPLIAVHLSHRVTARTRL